MTRRTFRLIVVGANLGRKYAPGVYQENVRRIVRKIGDHDHYALLPQEVDEEPDPANEHRVLRAHLEPGIRRVYWRTREPIILSPTFRVKRRKRVKIMGSGLEIGGPAGTGPERTMSTCIATCQDADLFFGNWHPHRSGLHPKVDEARDEGADIAADTLTALSRRARVGRSGIYTTDYNARHMPRMVPGEKVAHHRGLDHMRYVEHDDGARLRLLDHGTLDGTIDGHDPLWALFDVTPR